MFHDIQKRGVNSSPKEKRANL